MNGKKNNRIAFDPHPNCLSLSLVLHPKPKNIMKGQVRANEVMKICRYQKYDFSEFD